MVIGRPLRADLFFSMPHKGYNTSYINALKQLTLLREPAANADRLGASFDDHGFELEYFGNTCTLSFPECVFQLEDLSLGEKILILHYLTSDQPLEPNPSMTTFQSLPGGMFYYSTFRKRGPNRTLAEFGAQPDQLDRVAAREGWQTGSLGDVCVILPALPRIDVTVVAHRGDDEFPPEVQFLFRKDITSLLPLEDVAVLGGIVATKITIAGSRLS